MRRRFRLALLLGAILAATAALLLLLFIVPFPQSFVLHDAAIYDPNFACSGIDTTRGTTVSCAWSAPSPIYFWVVSCAENGPVYSENGTGGSGSFVSVGGFYEFGASCPEGPCVSANVSGTFTGPILHF